MSNNQLTKLMQEPRQPRAGGVLVLLLYCIQGLFAQNTQSLALSPHGETLFFNSQLLLHGELSNAFQRSRIYRYAPVKPEIEVQAAGGESFSGVFLASDGTTLARYCRRVDAGVLRPISYDGVCLKQSYFRGTQSRISRNGRFILQRDTAFVLRDLETGITHPMPDLPPLHDHNALSDNGTLVTRLLTSNAVVLVRPDEPFRKLYEGDPVELAAISPDGRYVFVREDSPNGISSLIEIEVSTLAQRTLLRTQNDKFNFMLDQDASHILIRYFQAISLWSRASNTIDRLADSPDLITAATISDDGTTIAYQRNNCSISRIAGGETEELYPATPTRLSPMNRTVYPGSAVFFSAAGFDERTEITIEGQTLPVLRLKDTSIQAQELLVQIPWDVHPYSGVILATRPESPFLLRYDLAFLQEPSASFFNVFDPAARSFVVAAALEDFSGLASKDNPAPSGSIIHAYLGALGPLDQPVGTGEPGPANPPAKPLATIRCTLRNLDFDSAPVELEVPTLVYAPGLVGVYQADLRIPADWPTAYNQLRCGTTLQTFDETRLFTKRYNGQ